MPLKAGDKMLMTRQRDDTFNVVIDMMSRDHGDQRVVANVKDPDAYYTHVRDEFDNPYIETRQDLEDEKKMLISRRAALDSDIAKVDAAINERDL